MADKPSFYTTFRKRIAPLAFLIALVALGTHTCSTEMADVTITFEMGAAATDVRTLRVDVFAQGESTGVINFERHYGERGAKSAPSIEAQLDAGTYELAFTVTTTQGRHRFDRVVEVVHRAAVTVNLERDLTPGQSP